MFQRLRIALIVFSFLLLPTALLAQDRVANPDSLFGVALRLQRSGEMNEAERIARLILTDYPRYYDARVLVARIAAWSGNHDAALEELNTVLSAQPHHRDARLAKATVLSWRKEYAKAIEMLRELLDEKPDAPDIAAELGKVYLWNNEPRMAYRYYEQSYGLDSLSTEVVRGLARASLRMNEHELSLIWYRRLLEMLPRDGEAHSSVQRLEYRSRHELLVQGSVESFTRKDFDNHFIWSGEYYNGTLQDVKPYVHVSTLSKFGKRAERIGAGLYWSPGYSTGFMGQVIASPRSSIAANWDATAEISYVVGSGLELIGAYRFLSFPLKDVHIGSPGVSWYLSGTTWLTLRAYFSSGTGGSASRTGVATIVHKPDELTTIRISGSTGSEVQQSGVTQQEIARRSAGVTISAKRRLMRTLAVGLSYQFSSREPSNSHTFLLTTSLYF